MGDKCALQAVVTAVKNKSDGEDGGQQGVDPEAGAGDIPGRGSGKGCV